MAPPSCSIPAQITACAAPTPASQPSDRAASTASPAISAAISRASHPPRMCRTPTRRPHSPAHRCRVGTPARRTPGSRACFHPIQGRPAPARPRLAGTLPLQAWRGWSGPGQAERTDRRTGKALGARTARAVPRLRTARVSPCSLLTAGREAGQDQLPRRGCGRIIRDGGSNRRTALVLGEEFQALTFCPGGAVLRPGNHAGRELRSRAGQALSASATTQASTASSRKEEYVCFGDTNYRRSASPSMATLAAAAQGLISLVTSLTRASRRVRASIWAVSPGSMRRPHCTP